MAPQASPGAKGEAQTLVERAACWTRHWQGGALHSCQPSSGTANYGGDIAAFWDALFAGMPDGGRVLEPCCGNAPLAKLLLDGPHGARVDSVSAVDIAEVAPAWVQQAPLPIQQKVDIRGGVDVAALPWTDPEFDLCVSQFGLEYAPKAALAEVSRVLRRGGQFGAIVHHSESLTAAIAQEETTHADWLKDGLSLHALAAKTLAFLADAARSSDPNAARATEAGRLVREGFNVALSKIAERIERSQYPDLLFEQRELVMHAVRSAIQGQIAQGEAELEVAALHLQDARLRQQELLEAAMDRDEVLAWIAPLHPRESEVRPVSFRPGSLAGWSVLVRPG